MAYHLTHISKTPVFDTTSFFATSAMSSFYCHLQKKKKARF